MKATLTFNDGSTFVSDVPEDILMEQMSRVQEKRLYVCGIEFSEVQQVEVLK